MGPLPWGLCTHGEPSRQPAARVAGKKARQARGGGLTKRSLPLSERDMKKRWTYTTAVSKTQWGLSEEGGGARTGRK